MHSLVADSGRDEYQSPVGIPRHTRVLAENVGERRLHATSVQRKNKREHNQAHPAADV